MSLSVQIKNNWLFATEKYERIFGIEEIRTQPILQWYFGASILFFFLTFSTWLNSSSITVEDAQRGSAVCWPYFQSCWKLFFFHDLSVDYSRSIFYMVLYGILALIVYSMWRRKWTQAHALLALLWLWEVAVAFIFAYSITAPFYYYHAFLTAILLFVPYKEYFLKIAFVLFYFLSVTIKFDDGWVLGTYFTTLKTGLPIFPDALTPLFTNIVIFSQVIGCWFLLSTRRLLQRSALVFFTFFHLYSGTFVQYMYPTAALPPLLILFGPLYRHTPTPFSRKSIAGWLLLVCICIFQVLGFITPGDRRLTLEGNRFGMFMFEANHECVITATIYERGAHGLNSSWEAPMGTPCTNLYCMTATSATVYATTTVITEQYESGSSLYRCDPYNWWQRYKIRCANNPLTERVALQFDHSINGGPFYRIVDTQNICAENYQVFTHNPWILLPPQAQIDGYPVQDYYHSD